MYKVMKATVVVNGKPVYKYELDLETEDLNEARAVIARRYVEECTENVHVDLLYRKIKE